jgi:hypothetical protein
MTCGNKGGCVVIVCGDIEHTRFECNLWGQAMSQKRPGRYVDHNYRFV